MSEVTMLGSLWLIVTAVLPWSTNICMFKFSFVAIQIKINSNIYQAYFSTAVTFQSIQILLWDKEWTTKIVCLSLHDFSVKNAFQKFCKLLSFLEKRIRHVKMIRYSWELEAKFLGTFSINSEAFPGMFDRLGTVANINQVYYVHAFEQLTVEPWYYLPRLGVSW